MTPDPAFRRATWTVFALIGALALIHAARGAIARESDLELLFDYGFIPARLTAAFDPAGVRAALAGGPLGRAFAEYLVAQAPAPHTLVTYALLHANVAHVAVNSVWLAAFGSAVARRFGALRFVLFCIVAALAGALAHLLVHPYDGTIVIGASAVVSGAMGAAARFAFAPGAPLGGDFRLQGDLAAYRGPRVPIRAVFTESRALTFVGAWMASNLIFAFATPGPELGGANIAWQAHIGGFLAGFLGIALFEPPRR